MKITDFLIFTEDEYPTWVVVWRNSKYRRYNNISKTTLDRLSNLSKEYYTTFYGDDEGINLFIRTTDKVR